ncbi:MAG: alpha-galactosidase [Eubacteriales bacterium]
MPIKFYEDKKIFKLDTAGSSYAIALFDGGYLLNYYYGAKVPDVNFTDYYYREWFASFSAHSPSVNRGDFSADIAPIEYSGFGVGDFRKTAVAIRNADGNDCTDFRYARHRIFKGKPAIPPLPSLYANTDDECETLEIDVCDKVTGARAVLSYTVFEKYSAMTKSVRIINASDKPMDIEKAYSASVSLNSMDFDMLHLYGRHNAERNMARTPLKHGHASISSVRGSSSHFHNPFAALVRHGADEDHGDVYGFNLVYSGNFDITADVDYYETTRVNIGINPDGFTWHLEPGEEFQTPEAVLVYSNEGLGGMSRTFHRLYNNNLVRGKWKTEKRPLLINSWEAAYFDFDTDKLVSFAQRAKELGIEMLVMDDGWFGVRNDDRRSLGDWYVNEDKLKGGLGVLIDKVNALGLKFGIWYEPEMISPDSDLYRAHPDWCIHVPGRDRSLGRNQCVIDMSREDVRENIYAQMKSVLSKYKIDYLKWDFNRNLTEAGSALLSYEHGEEIFHRFILGTYEIMGRLNRDFPDMLIENCSGGGGRFDPAMLSFSPQIWASDNTDAIERIAVQFGTSLCYPASTMGAHVSMNGRTGFETKGNVAMWGTFGYELDPNRLSEKDREIVKKQVAQYHRYYNLTHYGDLYRIVSPWENSYYSAWELVSEDKNEMMFTLVNMRYYHCRTRFIRFKGLDENKYYRLYENGEVYSGALLMNAGLNLSRYPSGTGESFVLHFDAVE